MARQRRGLERAVDWALTSACLTGLSVSQPRRGYDVYEHSVALHKRRIIQDQRPLVCKTFPDIMDHSMVHYIRCGLIHPRISRV